VTVSGIDVASYQSTAYSTTGLGFVMVKATEGTGYVNPRHAAQIATGRQHQLVVGHYHFVRPGSITAQANFFLSVAAPKAGDILVLDWEDKGVSGADKDAWLKYVQAKTPHNRVELYCNLDFWHNHDKTGYVGDGLWIADPGAPAGHPRVNHPWVMHQYSEAGGLDRDVANFAGAAELRTWAAKGATPHAPVYEPFPGAKWFTAGRRSPIVAAMHARLVANGCGRYRSHTNVDVIGSGDIASYEAWQRKCGFVGAAAKWPPGKTTWDKLHVPNV
jgi:hypothetical protein